ncbi:50S ribosomal protein L17 [Candidatus Saccharibacteria bacterium]|nr:50S ribosomal protein L17 [Candidatus Saccharibacteria bacterium]
MHRHGYKGRKFGRETDQRSALIKSLAESLVRDGSIKTTISKAKELVPYMEKLITKAKVGDLHNRRQVINGLQTIESAHKLVDDMTPKMSGRTSGHLRITKLENRRGDNTLMAQVSFVDDLKEAPVAKDQSKAKSTVSKSKAKTSSKKPAAKETK